MITKTNDLRMRQRLGQNLRRLRYEKGLTQEQLEELSGLSQATISLYETGRSGWARESILQLAAALEVDVEEFFLRPETREQLGCAQILAGLPASDVERIKMIAESFRQLAEAKAPR